MKIKESYTDIFSSHSQSILLKRVDSRNSNLPARHSLSRLKVDPYSLGGSIAKEIGDRARSPTPEQNWEEPASKLSIWASEASRVRWRAWRDKRPNPLF